MKKENALLLSDQAEHSLDVPGPLGGWTPDGSGSRDRHSKPSVPARSATTEPDRPYLRAATGQEDGRMSASLDPASASGAPSPQQVYAARMAASTDRAQPTKGGGPSPKKGSFLKRGTSGGGRNGNSGGSFSNSRQVKQDSGEHREGRILEDEEPGEGGSLGTPRWAEWRGWAGTHGCTV